MSASSPPGGFHLQQQDLEAQLMPEVYLPLTLSPEPLMHLLSERLCSSGPAEIHG